MSGSTGGADRGSVSVLVAVLALAIVTALALVVDGGRTLGALSEARDIADNAARAGSQEVDLELWRDTGRPVVDQGRAADAVAAFLADSGLGARVTGWRLVPTAGPDADISVTVEVSITPASFLFPARTVTAAETASALDGVTAP